MSPTRFQSASEISTNYRCDNCGILISQFKWKRCELCKAFDLCQECGATRYSELPTSTLEKHRQIHSGTSFDEKNSMQPVFIEDADNDPDTTRDERRQTEYERIVVDAKIENDFEMFMIMNKLKKNPLAVDDLANSLIVQYYLRANQRNIHVLSLDGGGKTTHYSHLFDPLPRCYIGVRGYMPIKILTELITKEYLPDMKKFDVENVDHRDRFYDVQSKFTRNFDYFVGTSTGGLIAFCLATGCKILDLMEIYSRSGHYFKRNRLGPWVYSKYDPAVIHKKIDDIINQITFPGNKKISAENATLLDIRNLLNPDRIIDEKDSKSAKYTHGNFLEFDEDVTVDHMDFSSNLRNKFHRVPREKVLLITAYNTTTNTIMIFNTSYSKHWGYRIADVLKSTMAAPTYFPPQEVFQWTQENGHLRRGDKSELFIDGGVFANDPELVALAVCRVQWKKPANYHILSIGTGTYTVRLSPNTWGGYLGWICNNGLLVNTLMDATRSLTEIIGGNLAKFDNIRRMKLNYKIVEAMELDDPTFVDVFNEEWNRLKNEPDFKAFVYFYKTQIMEKKLI